VDSLRGRGESLPTRQQEGGREHVRASRSPPPPPQIEEDFPSACIAGESQASPGFASDQPAVSVVRGGVGKGKGDRGKGKLDASKGTRTERLWRTDWTIPIAMPGSRAVIQSQAEDVEVRLATAGDPLDSKSKRPYATAPLPLLHPLATQGADSYAVSYVFQGSFFRKRRQSGKLRRMPLQKDAKT
jgi:hypothetical protein